MNKKIANYLYVTLIVCVIIFMFYTINFMITYKDELTRHPFFLGIEQMGGNIDCSCIQSSGYPGVMDNIFTFNDTTIVYKKEKVGTNLNISFDLD